MKTAFLTEMQFTGQIPADFPNMRTEFAWMHALNSTHHCIRDYSDVKGYDHVFVIFPKGRVYLSAEGSRLITQENPVTDLLQSEFIQELKSYNAKVYYVQEGPHWWFTDYELSDQIHFYNMLTSCDAIFSHNVSDTLYYKGLIPNIPVYILPSLIIEHEICNINPIAEEKCIIGGNFARWYGGFESYIIAQEFDVPICGQTSHAMRHEEDQLFRHLPRLMWVEWMRQLSTFKYAVHLMPTVAAGTFSLNCAYFGIPCIGNEKVDTQRVCYPDLSIDVDNLYAGKLLAQKLKSDIDFYNHCSAQSKELYKTHFSVQAFHTQVLNILS